MSASVDLMAQELSTEDAKALLALCASGRLYVIEAWMHAGRSLQVPRALKKTPVGRRDRDGLSQSDRVAVAKRAESTS